MICGTASIGEAATAQMKNFLNNVTNGPLCKNTAVRFPVVEGWQR